MKLDKFIRDYCCNLVRNECIGVWGNKRFNTTDICHPLNKEEPEACGFFEKIVLPAAIQHGCHEELVDAYSKIDFGVVARTVKVRKIESKKARNQKKKTRKYAKSFTR